MLGHINLSTYYHLLYNMVRQSKITLTEYEEMIPYERYMYLDMISADLEMQEYARKQAKNR